MTKKIRLIRTMVVEYVPDERWYPEKFTIEQMAQLDATSDRELMFSGDRLIKDEVKWEIVED
ncbi:UNVERIFIED_ORG: hypothetical protein BDK47_11673 [Anoxybacillus amylolyticus]